MSIAKNEKISILLPDMRPGGAERLHLHLANEWLKDGIKVEFVLRQAKGELLSEVPTGATVIDLGAVRVRNALLPLARYLRHSRPGVLLAAMWPLTVVAPLAATLAGFQGRVAVSEHSPLSIAYRDAGWFHQRVLHLTTKLGYGLASECIGVSVGVADDMSRISGLSRDQFAVVNNPAALGRTFAGMSDRPEALRAVSGPLLLSVGTLKTVKRHDLLLEAFARLPEALNVSLCILGEGPQREMLEHMVEELGLSGRVFLPGFVAETAPWYAHADVFVLSSDYEGFGNVIVEAMEQGVPVVSTDCPSGPREILCNGKYGRLVPVNDADALASAMRAALIEPPDSGLLQARARDFAVERIADQYLDLLLPGWRDGVRA